MLHILVADDHGIVRSGLRMLIERQDGMRVVAEAEDGVAAVEAALREQPDVAVLDVSMPRITGVQAAREIKSRCPESSVILLSMHDEERYLYDGLKAGASGYVLKRAADEDLIEAVRSVAAGRPFLSAITQTALVKEWVDQGEQEPRERLTPREREVLALIARGMSNKLIARELGIAKKTVKTHVGHLLAKLGVADRTQAAVQAIELGLLPAVPA